MPVYDVGLSVYVYTLNKPNKLTARYTLYIYIILIETL